MGLAHPHESSTNFPAPNHDQLRFSIMSYKGYEGQPTNSGYALDFYPITPMIDDIATLQAMYGANLNYHATGDIYKWATGAKIFETIWDTGGIDQIDASNQLQGAMINLEPGTLSQVGTAIWNGQSYMRDTLGIAYGAIIENARGTAYSDTILGNGAANTLWGGSGNDTLSAGGGNDTVDGGLDVDTLVLSGNLAAYAISRPNATDLVLTRSGESVTVRGVESIQFADGTRTFGEVTGNTASAFGDELTGTAGDDSLDGLAGNDTLIGLAGNDTLIGGLGNDSLVGGAGDDTYSVDVAADIIVELAGEGTDTVNVALASGTYVLGETLENAAVTSAGAVGLTGNAGNNVLTGNAVNNSLSGGAGNDTLDGGAGTDTLIGGAGDDTYVVNMAGDVINETVAGSDGIDQVNVAFTAAGTYILSANVENAFIGNGQAGVNITGNAQSNWLDGNEQANVISGGAGGDNLTGHGGNDTIDGGVVLDRINYTDGNWLSYSSSTSGVIVNLSSITGDGSVGFGTASDGLGGTDRVMNVQFIRGSDHNDSILGSSALIFEQFEGGAGNDTLDGGAITDANLNFNRVSYTNAAAAVVVDLAAGTASGGAGDDQISNFNQVRGSAHNDTLLGSNTSAYTEAFEGRAGNDSIDGRGGYDMVRYDAATTGVNVNLVTGLALDGQGGTDTLTGIEGIRGGNFNDLLTGGNAANGVVLSDGLMEFFRGNGGSDTIDGGQGYDRADYDSASTGVTVTLGGTGNGTAQDGQGGTDTLISIEAVRGSDFADVLNGSDTGEFESLEGNKGNDTIDGNGGFDRVDYSRATAAVNVNISNIAAGTASDGQGGTDTLRDIEWVRGSAFNDTIVGSAAANNLEGRAGNDSISGGAGNDTLSAGGGNDTVDGGLDVDTLVLSGNLAAYAISRPNATDLVLTRSGESVTVRGVESIQFADGTRTFGEVTGNTASAFGDELTGTAGDDSLDGLAGNDTLIGLAGNDTLIGGLGNDSLVGGAGDDTYSVDVAADIIVELAGEGTDTVNVALASGTYVLGETLENAAVTSAGAVGLTGNAGNNVLTGNAVNNSLSGGAGNDTLDGGAGTDTLIGGAGDDTYVVNMAGDVINETVAGSDGIDQVNVAFTAAGTYILSANVENAFILTGIHGVGLTGNSSNNLLIGGNGHTALSGGIGNDTLNGLGGNDTLTGGAGADLFIFDTSPGVGNVDTINDFQSGVDTIGLSSALFTGLGAVGDHVGLSANLTYNSITGALAYDADGAGGGAAVQIVILGASTHPAVLGNDFLLI